ncbi:hypothetical protein V6N13_050147 [Hibiscus sabdariffa]
MAVGFVKTVFVLVATFFLDKIGRRPLLLSSAAGIVISLAMLGLSLTVIDRSDQNVTWAIGLCITMVLSNVAVFSIGMGPVTWVYSTEILPLRLRAQGTSIGVAFNRGTSGLVSMTFISLYESITIGGAFFLYTSMAVAAFCYFYVFFPETRGRTLEEMEGLFGELVGWRKKFKKIQKENDRKMKEVNGDRISNGQI